MKILVIGGTGTIGKMVVNELDKDHSLIVAGHHQGEVRVDISSEESIRQLYQTTGKVDAVVCAAGDVYFGALTEMTAENYQVGLQHKLMGQVNLVLLGLSYLNDGGSFTLTSGILSQDPIRYGSSAAMINGAINAFVKSAAIELPRGIRINAVSPTVLLESMPLFGEYFKGYEPVQGSRVATAYRKSVDGAQTGQVYRVGY